jgi:hypothetical protein
MLHLPKIFTAVVPDTHTSSDWRQSEFPSPNGGCLATLAKRWVPGNIAEFPGLEIERRGGYVIAPWRGKEDGERGEAFAARMRAETRCMVADRRNGRIVELEQGVNERAAG